MKCFNVFSFKMFSSVRDILGEKLYYSVKPELNFNSVLCLTNIIELAKFVDILERDVNVENIMSNSLSSYNFIRLYIKGIKTEEELVSLFPNINYEKILSFKISNITFSNDSSVAEKIEFAEILIDKIGFNNWDEILKDVLRVTHISDDDGRIVVENITI